MKLFKNNKKLSEKMCNSIIKEIDLNNDQMIDLNEFINFMKKSLASKMASSILIE